MIKSKIVLLSALVSCALISGCKEENKTNVSIEFMHSSVEQERQAVISKLIARFEKENPGITVKQVPVEEDAYNTKVITLSRSGSLPEVIETSHDYAKVMDKEQLIDRKAVATVISNVGEGAFYDGVLRIVRTEDGSAWTGVPVSAWIGGIWYRKDVLAKAGLEEPKNWQQLLDVAQKLNDPANKKYGIALPTAESVLTEQSFSQFALSNQANVFNAEGKITLDTPEMMQALTYYRDLAANTMPGSNDIMEVKDAFMNGTAPMAIYSTYILPAVIKEGDPKNVGFVVPTEKNSAVYGMLTSLTITAGQKTEETEAAEKFVTFMEQADNIADWVMMSPGAALPVNKAVVTTATWKDNDVIKALGELPNQLIGELPNIQVFGAVGDKNFTRMGDVTGSGVVSSMVHNVTVGKADLLARCKRARKSWMNWSNSTKPRTGIRNEQAFFRSFRYALCAVASRAQLITAGRSGGVADGVEYRNYFFTSAAQSQHRVNLCWGEQLCAYPLRSRLLALTVDDGLVHRAGGGGQHRARAGGGDVFQSRVPPAQNRAFAGDPLLRNAVHFAGVRLEIHVQQRLRHCELPRRRSSASL